MRYLTVIDPDCLRLAPGERASDNRLQGYAEELETGGCSSTSQHTYLQRLLVALQLVAPDRDWSSLAQFVRDMTPRQGDATDRLADVRHPAELLALAEQLMTEAENLDKSGKSPSRGAAGLFRDGLMLAVLCLTVLRRRSVLALALGDTLVETSSGYLILLRGEHTKSDRPELVPVHPELAAWLRRYLDHYRPVLTRGATDTAVWISERGRPLGGTGCWHAISHRTEAGLGVRIGPHFIRHCVATSTVLEQPERIDEIPGIPAASQF